MHFGTTCHLSSCQYALLCQHHALSNDSLAEFTSRYNIHYKSDRLTFDKSIAAGEIELLHPEHSADDFTRLTDFFEAIIAGRITVESLLQLQQQTQQPPVQNGNEETHGRP